MFRRAFAVAAALGLATAQNVTFLSEPVWDLQNMYNIAVPWLGADVATSVRIGSYNSSYLWLHGDTLYGQMSNGTRQFEAMPRNSVAMLNVTTDTGVPTTPYVHYIAPWSLNTTNPQHFGFWSPPLDAPWCSTQNCAQQWYWPTAGVPIGNDLHVVAMRIEPAGGGLFPFTTAGMDVLSIASPTPYDPISWPQPVFTTIPNVNGNFTVGNAVTSGSDKAQLAAKYREKQGQGTVTDTRHGSHEQTAAADDPDAGWVYMMGGFGPSGQTAMVTRISEGDFSAHNWANLQYWAQSTAPGAAWQTWSSTLSPVALFQGVPSETTLFWQPVLQGWYIVIANTFTSSDINIRTAPQVTGPWSDPIPVYPIPSGFLQNAFCYAGKAHPELSPPLASEFIFTFMCNTPGIDTLLNRTDIYVPRVIRTTITVN